MQFIFLLPHNLSQVLSINTYEYVIISITFQKGICIVFPYLNFVILLITTHELYWIDFKQEQACVKEEVNLLNIL